jgi:hypothetical protein
MHPACAGAIVRAAAKRPRRVKSNIIRAADRFAKRREHEEHLVRMWLRDLQLRVPQAYLVAICRAVIEQTEEPILALPPSPERERMLAAFRTWRPAPARSAELVAFPRTG